MVCGGWVGWARGEACGWRGLCTRGQRGGGEGVQWQLVRVKQPGGSCAPWRWRLRPAASWMRDGAVFALASGEPVPAVSTGQMREVDQSMAGDFGIDLPRRMENAGRNLADLSRRLFAPRTCIVLAAPGGNR